MSKSKLYILLWVFSISAMQKLRSQDVKPRIIITADPELDDNNSLIRLILYSSDFNIEGLIYTSSQFHWNGDGKGTHWYVPGREYDRFGIGGPYESWRWHSGEKFIHNIVDAYEKVYPNLQIHHKGYPLPAVLRSKIRYGNVKFDGDVSEDTPGSNLIKSLILDNKPGKLFITAWGGHSTIARALIAIKNQYEFTEDWDRIYKKISSKVVLLPSGDQDDTYTLHIKPYWPHIEYRQFSKGPNYGYGAQIRADSSNQPYLTPQWMTENITGQGALGALYRVWGDGKQMVVGDVVDYFGKSGYTDDELRKMGYKVWMPVQQKGSWLGEGDNHTWMNMPDNGLRAYEKGTYGGWGGVSSSQNTEIIYLSVDSSDQAMAERMNNANSIRTDFPDFFPEAQNDFAARMKWSVTNSYKKANHAPKVNISGPLILLASPGQNIKIHGSAADPDHDNLNYKWWQFMVGTVNFPVEIKDKNSNTAEFQIPAQAKSNDEFHIILEVKDDGLPVMTSYKRVIIKIK
jgi:hypothetical protein